MQFLYHDAVSQRANIYVRQDACGSMEDNQLHMNKL